MILCVVSARHMPRFFKMASMSLKSDGALVYNRAFNLGESETKLVDVADVFRIRFDMAQDDTTPDTEPSLGAGRVLCD